MSIFSVRWMSYHFALGYATESTLYYTSKGYCTLIQTAGTKNGETKWRRLKQKRRKKWNCFFLRSSGDFIKEWFSSSAALVCVSHNQMPWHWTDVSNMHVSYSWMRIQMRVLKGTDYDIIVETNIFFRFFFFAVILSQSSFAEHKIFASAITVSACVRSSNDVGGPSRSKHAENKNQTNEAQIKMLFCLQYFDIWMSSFFWGVVKKFAYNVVGFHEMRPKRERKHRNLFQTNGFRTTTNERFRI